MDGNFHNISIEMRLPIMEIRKVDVRQEAEILRVINLFNSTIQEVTGEAPVGRIAID